MHNKKLWDKNLRLRRRQKGLCVHCSKPSTKYKCNKCYQIDKKLRQKRKPPQKIYLCSICKSPDHNKARHKDI